MREGVWRPEVEVMQGGEVRHGGDEARGAGGTDGVGTAEAAAAVAGMQGREGGLCVLNW